jgi:hypothetical protein
VTGLPTYADLRAGQDAAEGTAAPLNVWGGRGSPASAIAIR